MVVNGDLAAHRAITSLSISLHPRWPSNCREQQKGRRALSGGGRPHSDSRTGSIVRVAPTYPTHHEPAIVDGYGPCFLSTVE
jgi:hypothetical protein